MPDSTWPNAYIVVASEEILRGLSDIADLVIDDHGQRQRDDGLWWLACIFATSEAIALASSARGCQADLMSTGAELEQSASSSAEGDGIWPGGSP